MIRVLIALALSFSLTSCFLAPQSNLGNESDGATLDYVRGADLLTEVTLTTGAKPAEDLVVVVGGKNLAVVAATNYGTCVVSKQASFVTCKVSSVPATTTWRVTVSGTVQTSNATFYRPDSLNVVFLRLTK